VYESCKYGVKSHECPCNIVRDYIVEVIILGRGVIVS
jgi:hypothetical protein